VSILGYIANIEEETITNTNFRKVLFTAPSMQLVAMSLLPGEEIGVEVHQENDQLFRIEKGRGVIVIEGIETEVEEDSLIIVPAGTEHNFVNTSDSEELKIYTVYSPPHHPVGTIHKTREEALAAEE
jgi:mannose-6-phosphate isomerase-like protein (cupin superfamily)